MTRSRSAMLAAVCLGAALTAHAGLLDEIGKAAEKLKQANDAVGSARPSAPITDNPSPSRVPIAGGSYQLPQAMPVYPNAELLKRVDNPFDRVIIPVSIPVKGPDGYLAPDSVPIEGRVTMLQYRHRPDDSPLLIVRHYREWLTAQGFEQIEICTMPCKAAARYSDWAKVADVSDRINSGYLPERPTYIAAYKPGAMALVGVGEDGSRFNSFVKVVEGKVIEPSIWQRVVAARNPPPRPVPNEPAPPAPSTPAGPGAAVAFADGSELVPKLSSLKLLQAPSRDAKVIATLSVADGLVYMGTEQAGFLQVTTSQGDGWVDRRLVRKP